MGPLNSYIEEAVMEGMRWNCKNLSLIIQVPNELVPPIFKAPCYGVWGVGVVAPSSWNLLLRTPLVVQDATGFCNWVFLHPNASSQGRIRFLLGRPLKLRILMFIPVIKNHENKKATSDHDPLFLQTANAHHLKPDWAYSEVHGWIEVAFEIDHL